MARPPRFQIDAIADLLDQIRYAPSSTRKRQMNQAEKVIAEIDPEQPYPVDYIIFRITSFRVEESTSESELLDGKTLISDLVTFIERLSFILKLSSTEYENRVPLTPEQTCEQLSIGPTTLHRYRKIGLVAHHVVDADGVDRLVYFEDAVSAFQNRHATRLERATRFSRIDEETRQRMIQRARRYHQRLAYSLQKAARRLATRFNRSPETIRQILRKYDHDHPDQTIFNVSGTLDDQQKKLIIRADRFGVPVRDLVKRTGRSRNTIYRTLNVYRVEWLRSLALNPIILPTFSMDEAESILLSPDPVTKELEPIVSLGGDAVEWVEAVEALDIPDESTETARIAALNFLLHTAKQEINDLSTRSPRAAALDRIETRLRWAGRLKHSLMAAFLHPVLITLEQHLGRRLLTQSSNDVRSLHTIAIGVLSRSIDQFDPTRGQRFQTFMTYALRRALAESHGAAAASAAKVRRVSGSLQLVVTPACIYNWFASIDLEPRYREHVKALDEIEQQVINNHYGLGGKAPQTHAQLADELNIRLSGVTVIEQRATRRLREMARKTIKMGRP